MTALCPAVVADLERENARLRAELRSARDRQAGSAEVLRTIAGAPGDAGRSLQQVAETTARLFGASSVTVLVASGDRWGQTIRVGEGSNRIAAALPHVHVEIRPEYMPGAVFLENRQIHIPDLDNLDPAMTSWPGLPPARAAGTRSMSGTPLRREGKPIGALIVHRDRLAPFTADELALLQSFADQAVIAIENARLFNETKEALERQTATADILKVIASSPSDVQPVFDAIAERSNQLVNGLSTSVLNLVDDTLHLVAYTQVSPAADAALRAFYPQPLSTFAWGETVRRGEIVRISDSEDEAATPPAVREVAQARGWRSAMLVPLLRDQRPIGMISVTRRETGPFADHHVQLLQTFADQAVIAIQNARLFNETKEALERQTATADILKVIASSPSDVQPVFEAIAVRAKSLVGGFSSTVFRFIDGMAHLEAFTPTTPEADEVLRSTFPRPFDDFAPFQMTQAGEVMQIPDTEDLTDDILGISRARGFRSMVFTPLMNKGASIGFIAVTRVQPGSFTDHHVQVLRTFADQAVIAIENARLFDEVQARTRDLTESLQQQTATSDVLKVISRSAFDLQTVLDTLAESAARLCGADEGTIMRPAGDVYRMAAIWGASPEKAAFLRSIALTSGGKTAAGRALAERRTIHIEDTQSDPDSALPGDPNPVRTRLGVPLLREGAPIGVFVLVRQEARPFTDKQIGLVQTFADQAVIAIENARLFDEVQARTQELSESLQQQTATAEVLKVISRSAFDLPSVLDTLVSSAARLCGDPRAAIYLLRNGLLHLEAAHNNSPEWIALRRSQPAAPTRGTPSGRAALTGQVDHVADLLQDSDFTRPDLVKIGDYRATLNVPLIREGETIGVLSLARPEPGPFTQRQIGIVQTFADQAVIAIENVRLFEEVQAKTRDLEEALRYQTGSANILNVIASSPTDVGPVLKAIVESACDLCGAYDAVVRLNEGDNLCLRAHQGPIPVDRIKWPINRNWTAGRSFIDRQPVHVHDMLSSEGNEFPEAQERARDQGHRTILSVPLLRDGASTGSITLRRLELNPFSDKQIALLQTFADQAVIAISNVQLFEQVEERTRELSKSLHELRTAQDRLIQTEKLASLGQLTAGIAHEIKNPLNFVNNFSALSSELTDELNDLLKHAKLADKMREEVDELTGLLKDNLQKVVQHGKRADSIVKNMLLHSREGSGEHRPADINALVDESLNLAYHGARAERPQFNVTLHRDFDPKAGLIDVFPQEITRVFLNLISNGFYAVTKRKADNGGVFDPIVTASTKDLGDHVEIRIRDNGTGIPPEVKEKMFNPFFTTKPAGEGTGLGLSMSHDIIVKQHGGTIDVASEPGIFTEFTVVLPRSKNISDKARG
jgi:two-component system, NtrC family, sensor kinase